MKSRVKEKWFCRLDHCFPFESCLIWINISIITSMEWKDIGGINWVYNWCSREDLLAVTIPSRLNNWCGWKNGAIMIKRIRSAFWKRTLVCVLKTLPLKILSWSLKTLFWTRITLGCEIDWLYNWCRREDLTKVIILSQLNDWYGWKNGAIMVKGIRSSLWMKTLGCVLKILPLKTLYWTLKILSRSLGTLCWALRILS